MISKLFKASECQEYYIFITFWSYIIVEKRYFEQQIFTIFIWDANYKKLVDASTLWKLHLMSLVGFSETQFGNSRKHVDINIHHAFPAIMTWLEIYDPRCLNNKEEITALNARVEKKGEKPKS